MVNKVALVTGGARRLGKDISIALSGIGYDIILNYNKTPKDVLQETISKINEKGVKVTPVKYDVSNVNEIKKMFQFIKTEYKTLDLLVNNAAIYSKFFGRKKISNEEIC
ncbi:MAG: SDR family NAD(P)-dependent oxidoreductase [Bacteroidota bacterium]|nr:SDR family NAD(P)-dependent oxidoreductase [Bacteroidota bacterium]